jgi:benzoyl-CoA reductase/2-hydroxyglutaryl-CoA dehydratase subunit BcrC/BadD/HgdB
VSEKIGFTSSIPVEIIFAAGYTPVDINNIFITSKDPAQLVSDAKMFGFPDTTCSWICGLYGTIIKEEIKNIIAVTGGDCAETIALSEVLKLKKINIMGFAYPHKPDKKHLLQSLKELANRVGTTLEAAEEQRIKLDKIRAKIHRLDNLLWKENKAWGNEVQLFQLSCSDFEGDPEQFSKKVDQKIAQISERQTITTNLRLGFLGVPPIISDLYDNLESQGARIVYNEVQRQFSLPYSGDLQTQYTNYTYPYGIYYRLEDIKTAIKERKLDGIIHYVQSFCFRSIEDIVLNNKLDIPILTIQGDTPSHVTPTMSIRIEAFLDMLERKKGK